MRPNAPSGDGGGDHWALVAVAGALSFVAMLDMNIVNVALASIGRTFEVAPSTALWAMLGYQLSVVSLLLPVGRWLDTAGLRPVLLTAIAGFAAFSLAASVSPTMAWLIVSRIGQGAFGAVLFVLMPVLAARSVRPERRGRAMSVPATLGPLGAATGAAVGGLLTDAFGWRSVFLIKIPFCIVAFVVAWRAAPRGGTLAAPDRRSVADALLIATGVVLVLVAVTFARDSAVWLLLVPLAAVPVARWVRSGGGAPVRRVLGGSGTAQAVGAVLLGALAFSAMTYLVALHLQLFDGIDAATTGRTVLAFSVAMGLAGPVGGRLADRWGAGLVAAAGAALTATGMLLLLTLGEGWTPGEIVWRFALAGLGMGLQGGPTQMLVMSSAAREQMATAGSTVQLSRSLGFTLGPPLAALAWAAGGAGPDVRAGLGLAAAAGCAAVVLLVVRNRPRPHPAARAATSDHAEETP